jgi:hypothetical protein
MDFASIDLHETSSLVSILSYSGVHSHATSAKCPVLRSLLANTTAICQPQVASE